MFKQNDNPPTNDVKPFIDEVMKVKKHIDSTIQKFERNEASKSQQKEDDDSEEELHVSKKKVRRTISEDSD